MDTASTVIPAPRVARSPGGAAAAGVSRVWYWVALTILALGVVVSTAWGMTGVNAANEEADAFPRATVPGAVTVAVTAPGDQMVYFTGSADRSPAELGLRVTGPAGAPVPITPYDLALQVDLAGHVGAAVATFPAAAPGAYTVTSATSSAQGGAIVVGGNVVRDALPDVLGALAVLLLSVLVAIVIVIVTLVRGASRSSRDRAGVQS